MAVPWYWDHFVRPLIIINQIWSIIHITRPAELNHIPPALWTDWQADDDDDDDFSMRQGSVETRQTHNDGFVRFLKRASCGCMWSSLEMAMWLHDRLSSVPFDRFVVACRWDAFTAPRKIGSKRSCCASALAPIDLHSDEITLLFH